MHRRALVLIVASVAGIVAFLAGYKYWRVSSMIATAASFGEPAEARRDVVTTAIARKTLRAPFRGRIGLRDVHPGQYLAEGTEITTLESVADGVYVDFRLAQELAAQLTPGAQVRLSGGALRSDAEAGVRAIDAPAHEASRTVRLRAA